MALNQARIQEGLVNTLPIKRYFGRLSARADNANLNTGVFR